MVYGYARVSHTDQNLERQISQLMEYVTDPRNIITDKVSGKDFQRKGYNLLVGTDESSPILRSGDLLIITSLDRLGRNYEEICKQWEFITHELNVDIKVLDMPLLDTTIQKNNLDSRFIADLVLQILSYVSEKERINIRERQRQGIELAKAAGKYKGRKPIEINEKLLIEECAKWQSGKQTAVQTMKNCNISKTLFYRKVKELGIIPIDKKQQ